MRLEMSYINDLALRDWRERISSESKIAGKTTSINKVKENVAERYKRYVAEVRTTVRKEVQTKNIDITYTVFDLICL